MSLLMASEDFRKWTKGHEEVVHRVLKKLAKDDQNGISSLAGDLKGSHHKYIVKPCEQYVTLNEDNWLAALRSYMGVG